MRTLAINSKLINKGRFRLDGGFYLNIHSFLSLYLEANEERCVKLEDIADVMIHLYSNGNSVQLKVMP